MTDFHWVIWELKFWAPWKKFLTRGFYYRLFMANTDLQRRRSPAPFYALPCPANSGRRFPDKGTYCLSMVTGPQPKLWSVGICVKFKTAVRERKTQKKNRDSVSLLSRVRSFCLLVGVEGNLNRLCFSSLELIGTDPQICFWFSWVVWTHLVWDSSSHSWQAHGGLCWKPYT